MELKTSQLKTIAYHLGSRGSITVAESYDEYDITRLSAYIYILRHKYGWVIRNEWVYTRKHWWSFKKTRFVKYILEKRS